MAGPVRDADFARRYKDAAMGRERTAPQLKSEKAPCYAAHILPKSHNDQPCYQHNYCICKMLVER